LNMHFRRSLSPADLVCWSALRDDLASFSLSAGQDRVSWTLEPSGMFSVSSMYNHLLQGELGPMQRLFGRLVSL
jgi:hypothetical protein